MNRQQREELLENLAVLEKSRNEYIQTYAGVSVSDRTVRAVQLRKALENVKRPFAQLCEKVRSEDWLFLPFDLPEPACVRESELTYFALPPKTLSQLVMLIAASIKKQNVTVLSICTRNLVVYEMMFGFWAVPQKDHLDERVAAITNAEEKTNDLFARASEEFERILKMTDLVKTQMVYITDAEQQAKSLASEAGDRVAEIQELTDRLNAQREALEEVRESVAQKVNEAESKDKLLAEKIEAAEALIAQAGQKIAEIDAQAEKSLKAFDANLAVSNEKVEEIKKLMGFVGGGVLGYSFNKRKKSLGWKSRFWLFVSLVLFGGTSWWIYTVFTSLGAHTGTVWADIVINIAMSSSAIFAFGYALNAYGKERNLQEEYAFREAVSLTLTAYLEQLDACDNVEMKKLLADTVEKLYTKPYHANFAS